MQVLIAMQVLESSKKQNSKKGKKEKAQNLNILIVSDLFQTCFRPVSDLLYAIIILDMVLVVDVPML